MATQPVSYTLLSPTMPDLPPYSPFRKTLNTLYNGWVVLRIWQHMRQEREESGDVSPILTRKDNSTQTVKIYTEGLIRGKLRQAQGRILYKRFGC